MVIEISTFWFYSVVAMLVHVMLRAFTKIFFDEDCIWPWQGFVLLFAFACIAKLAAGRVLPI